MIIVGGISSTSSREGMGPALRFNVDIFIPEFKQLADVVHGYGTPIIAELVPSLGRMSRPPGDGRIISASPLNVVVPESSLPHGIRMPGGFATRTPDEATIGEIQQYEREMIESAARVQRAGWDGVEVAAHMSYFAASFLSPRTNWRTDEYGGSRENRARILTNTVNGIRAITRPEFVVGLRILSNDYMPDGQGAGEFAAIAKLVEEAGADYVAMAPGCYETMNLSATSEDGYAVDCGDARVFKSALSKPLFLQALHDPLRAAQAIADGHGDVVMLARPLLADPEYANKACQGRFNEIVRCDRQNHCLRRLMLNMPMRCSVNPQMGREHRKSGSLPPLRRIVQAPIEAALLGLTGSKTMMDLVALATRK